MTLSVTGHYGHIYRIVIVRPSWSNQARHITQHIALRIS